MFDKLALIDGASWRCATNRSDHAGGIVLRGAEQFRQADFGGVVAQKVTIEDEFAASNFSLKALARLGTPECGLET